MDIVFKQNFSCTTPKDNLRILHGITPLSHYRPYSHLGNFATSKSCPRPEICHHAEKFSDICACTPYELSSSKRKTEPITEYGPLASTQWPHTQTAKRQKGGNYSHSMHGYTNYQPKSPPMSCPQSVFSMNDDTRTGLIGCRHTTWPYQK